jgi:hypothetical protein
VEAHLVEPAAAPLPEAADWIDNCRDEDCVNQIGAELDAPGDGAGDDRGCRCCKGNLEEEVHLRIQPADAVGGFADAEAAPGEHAGDHVAPIHDAVADGPEDQHAQAHVDQILEHDVDDVLGGVEANFDQGKTCLHEEHQHGRNEQDDIVDRIGEFRCRFTLSEGAGRQQAQHHRQRHRS